MFEKICGIANEISTVKHNILGKRADEGVEGGTDAGDKEVSSNKEDLKENEEGSIVNSTRFCSRFKSPEDIKCLAERTRISDANFK